MTEEESRAEIRVLADALDAECQRATCVGAWADRA